MNPSIVSILCILLLAILTNAFADPAPKPVAEPKPTQQAAPAQTQAPAAAAAPRAVASAAAASPAGTSGSTFSPPSWAPSARPEADPSGAFTYTYPIKLPEGTAGLVFPARDNFLFLPQLARIA